MTISARRVSSKLAARICKMTISARRVASKLAARIRKMTSAPEESRVNSRLGPVSELTRARRFSGRAEPRLQPRLEERGGVVWNTVRRRRRAERYGRHRHHVARPDHVDGEGARHL